MRLSLLLLAACLAASPQESRREVIEGLKDYQHSVGFGPTGNFAAASDRSHAAYRCYYTGKLELPESYDGLKLKEGSQSGCALDESRYDVFFYPIEAVASGRTPVTASMNEAPLERTLVVVPHEDFHQSPEMERLPAPLHEAAATLIGFLTAAGFARKQYGVDSEVYRHLSREPDLFLRKAEIVNRYHARLAALYADVRAGNIPSETALVRKVRLFLQAQDECRSIEPDPVSFNKCLSAPNNAGLAFDYTYTRHYPRLHGIYEENGRRIETTLQAIRAIRK